MSEAGIRVVEFGTNRLAQTKKIVILNVNDLQSLPVGPAQLLTLI